MELFYKINITFTVMLIFWKNSMFAWCDIALLYHKQKNIIFKLIYWILDRSYCFLPSCSESMHYKSKGHYIMSASILLNMFVSSWMRCSVWASDAVCVTVLNPYSLLQTQCGTAQDSLNAASLKINMGAAGCLVPVTDLSDHCEGVEAWLKWRPHLAWPWPEHVLFSHVHTGLGSKTSVA